MTEPQAPENIYKAIIHEFVNNTRLRGSHLSVAENGVFSRAPVHQKFNEFIGTLSSAQRRLLSEMLLEDTHDLIHKSVGWMLREVGNRDQEIEEIFLKKYARIMPRTMLRYSIEKFDDKKRKHYMKK